MLQSLSITMMRDPVTDAVRSLALPIITVLMLQSLSLTMTRDPITDAVRSLALPVTTVLMLQSLSVYSDKRSCHRHSQGLTTTNNYCADASFSMCVCREKRYCHRQLVRHLTPPPPPPTMRKRRPCLMMMMTAKWWVDSWLLSSHFVLKQGLYISFSYRVLVSSFVPVLQQEMMTVT